MNELLPKQKNLPVFLAPASNHQVGMLTLDTTTLNYLTEFLTKVGDVHIIGSWVVENEIQRLLSVSFLYYHRIKPVEEYTNEELLNIVLTRMKDNP